MIPFNKMTDKANIIKEMPTNAEATDDYPIADKSENKEGIAILNNYRDELITIHSKSQESFEKQLSFITAGALGLSIGFIKDIVKPFIESSYKGLLGWGWGLLVLTLLLNCISHLLSARYSNKTIKEINDGGYEPSIVNKRNNRVSCINWVTTGTMIIGITLIVYFITYNTLL